jgi:hypothetical protein
MLLAAAAVPLPLPAPLNGAGLLILVAATSGILTLVTWCYWRILRRPQDPEA